MVKRALSLISHLGKKIDYERRQKAHPRYTTRKLLYTQKDLVLDLTTVCKIVTALDGRSEFFLMFEGGTLGHHSLTGRLSIELKENYLDCNSLFVGKPCALEVG